MHSRQYKEAYWRSYDARATAIVASLLAGGAVDDTHSSAMSRDLVRATALAEAEARRPGCPAWLVLPGACTTGAGPTAPSDGGDMHSDTDGSVTRIEIDTPRAASRLNRAPSLGAASSPLSPSIFTLFSGDVSTLATPVGGTEGALMGVSLTPPLAPLDSVSPIACWSQQSQASMCSFDVSQDETAAEVEEEDDATTDGASDCGTDGAGNGAAAARELRSRADARVTRLNVTLRPFQIRALEWMVRREATGDAAGGATPNPVRGGILALEMGLGKAVTTIALIHGAVHGHRSGGVGAAVGVAGPTLVVVPAALLNQWASELAEKAPSLKVCLFHGPRAQRPSDPIFISTFDVVITTYGVLAARDVSASRRRRRLCRIADQRRRGAHSSALRSKGARGDGADEAGAALSPAWIRTSEGEGGGRAHTRYHERWWAAAGAGGDAARERAPDRGLFDRSSDDVIVDELSSASSAAGAASPSSASPSSASGGAASGGEEGNGGGSARVADADEGAGCAGGAAQRRQQRRRRRGRRAAPPPPESDRNTLSLLHLVEWGRVVLDEAHLVANPATQRAAATRALVATARWCLTGTPVQKRARDASSLVRFVQGAQTAHLLDASGKTPPAPPTAGGSAAPIPAYKLKPLLRVLLLRETHVSLGAPSSSSADARDDGDSDPVASDASSDTHSDTRSLERSHSSARSGRSSGSSAISPLPLMRECTVLLEWGAANEHARYDASLYAWLTRCVDAVRAGADSDALGAAVHPSEWSLRLRQACCHPQLVRPLLAKLAAGRSRARAREGECEGEGEGESESGDEPATQADDAVSSLRAEGARLLRALDQLERAAGLGIAPRLVLHAAEGREEDLAPRAARRRARAQRHRCRSWSSLKVDGVVRYLDAADAAMERGNFKAIIVSQWPSFLRLVGDVLASYGWRCASFFGSTSPSERERALDGFRRRSSDARAASVLLLALDSGGFGLNLQNASHVIIADPALSLAKEQQAIGRARRIGRDEAAPLTVVRFLVRGTVEETVVTDVVQRRKAHGVDATLRNTTAGAAADADGEYITARIMERMLR